ncbi:hypothetical protein [Streptomyces sp. NPDC056154]|uniref:hypothetical protein n=1 Tax=unclassified Streptomyces TaxID=2593676 RepID=UPI0035DC68FC
MSRSIKWPYWKANSTYEHSRKCRLSSGMVARASAAAGYRWDEEVRPGVPVSPRLPEQSRRK